jgi:hypothetical protein
LERVVYQLLTEIVSDEQLIKLYTTSGYLVTADYSKKEVKLHTIDCMLADPLSTVGVKPSKARSDKIGEFWYSKSFDEANSKAEEIARKHGYNYLLCSICNPDIP